MNRPFWMKLIVGIVVFMAVLQGILPTNNIVLAGEEYNVFTHDKFECEKSGWYLLSGFYNTPIALFGRRGIDDCFYYSDSGIKKAPKFDNEGRVELEAGEVYYFYTEYKYKGSNARGDADTAQIMDGLYLVHIDDASKQNENLKKGEGYTYQGETIYVSSPDDASIMEGLITQILLLIGRGLYTVFCLVVGEAFSIEKVIFNDYSNTRLGFFNNVSKNDFIETSNVKQTLNDFFNFFSGITIAVYLIILIYMAIRILMGSTAEKGSKYKELIMYWVQGVLILFLFPYIMKYSISINDSFIGFISSAKDEYIDFQLPESTLPEEVTEEEAKLTNFFAVVDKVNKKLLTSDDFMSVMYRKANNTGWIVYAVCWYVMFFQMVGFLIVYFKRVLMILFLIVIFPLVMISYALDKIGDTKSQAFDNWVKEFMANVFVQSFHAITYVLIMSLICQLMDDPADNWLLILISLSFISKGDDILRSLFSLGGSANTIKGIGASFAETLAVTSIAKSVKGVGDRLIGEKSSARMFTGKVNQYWQKYNWDRREVNAKAIANQIEGSKLEEALVRTYDFGDDAESLKKSIQNDLNTLLGKNKDATDNEIRDAADRLTGIKDDESKKVMKDVLNSDEFKDDKEKAKSLLKANAAANALAVGGKKVNINNNVNIIFEALKSGKVDGAYSRESLAIMNKIAENEEDLNVMRLFGGNVRFKEEAPSNNPDNSSKGSNSFGRAIGRGATQNLLEGSSANSELEFRMMNPNAFDNRGKSSRKSIEFDVSRLGDALQGDDTRRESDGGTKKSSSSKSFNSQKSSKESNDENVSNAKLKEEIRRASEIIKQVNEEIESEKESNEEEEKKRKQKSQEGNEESASDINTNDVMKDLSDANDAILILNDAGSGKYTAKELLRNVTIIKEIIAKYKNTGFRETSLNYVLNQLECSVDSYEAFIRVQILNNPELVGNNAEIINDSKEYVRDTEISDVIMDKLAYDVEDIESDRSLSFVRQKEVDSGFVSASQKTRAQKEYETELARYNLEKERFKLDKKKESYSAKNIAKDAWDITKSGAVAFADTSISTVGSMGVGFMAGGMTTNNADLTKGTQNILAGYAASNTLYDNARNSVKGIAGDVKDFLTDDFEQKKKKDDEKFGKARPKKTIEELRDKTVLDESVFED